MVKQVDTNPVRQGNTFGYSLHITNNAPEVDATGVTLTDTLPSGVSYVDHDGNCTVDDATVICALDTLAKAGGTATVTITVKADAAPGTTITNTASVTADLPDVNSANNTDSVDTQVVNTAPVAGNLALVAYAGSTISGTLSATDANGDALTFSIVTNGEKGTAVITDAATGAFIYTPNADASGNDTFTFKVNDGLEDSNTATATVTIHNAAPVASDLALVAYAGSPVSGTLPAADANGDALTFSIVTNGEKGTVEITDAATGAFTYTPNAGESGTDSFTFKVSDGMAESSSAVVTVTIRPVPDPAPSGNGGGGALSPLALLLGLAAAARAAHRAGSGRRTL